MFAPRWQSREATNGAEQGANGGDESGVAARRAGRARCAGAADAAEPSAALGVHVHGDLALAYAEHSRRFRSPSAQTHAQLLCFRSLSLLRPQR